MGNIMGLAEVQFKISRIHQETKHKMHKIEDRREVWVKLMSETSKV